ncbi:uncharacterized protein [Mytilus edulis]
MTELGDVKPDETIDYSSIKPITLPIDKEYHTFIAYKAGDPDSGVALQIVELLEGKGYKCCIHEGDLLAGRSFLRTIARTIKRSIKVVFLLSENSSACEMWKYQLDVTETFHIETKGYKPIILKLDQCFLSDTLTKYTYLSADKPTEEWIGRLAKAINDETDHLVSSRRNIKFVAVPCIDYNRDKEHIIDTCRYPHICAKYIINDDICDGSCDKNHNLVTNQSREILVDLGFINEGNYDCILETYRQKCKEKLADMAKNGVTGPCCYYNYKGCLLGDFHCPFTHICKDWFLGKCLKRKCALSHDMLNDHTKRLLEIFEIDTSQDADVVLNTYRAKHPHKTFIPISASLFTKRILKENWLFLFACFLLSAFITAVFVKKS